MTRAISVNNISCSPRHSVLLLVPLVFDKKLCGAGRLLEVGQELYAVDISTSVKKNPSVQS